MSSYTKSGTALLHRFSLVLFHNEDMFLEIRIFQVQLNKLLWSDSITDFLEKVSSKKTKTPFLCVSAL